MFRFNPFKKNEQPAKQEEEAKKPGYIKSGAIGLALLTAIGAGSANAGEKNGQNFEKMGREKIDDVLKNNYLNEHQIINQLDKKGQKGRYGNTPVKIWSSPDGQKVVVGFDDNGGTKWFIYENSDASKRVVDYNANGSAERMIFNNQKKNTKIKNMDNDLNSFADIDRLSSQAKIAADVQPEKVEIYSFVIENGGRILKSVNFEDGKSYVTDEPNEVKKADSSVQTNFGKNLKEIKEAIEKN